MSYKISYVMIIVAIVLFQYGEFVFGTILLCYGLGVLIMHEVKKLYGEPKSDAEEMKSNYAMQFRFNISKILKHPEAEKVFEILRKNQPDAFQNMTKEQWDNLMVENYKKKFKKDDLIETVTFNIFDSLLLKEHEMSYSNAIRHYVDIPYQLKDEDGEDSVVYFIEQGITFRLILLNGIIKLQIGAFSKETSPHFLEKGVLSVYQQYATITSFPLLYVAYRYQIPVKFMNRVYGLPESYLKKKDEVTIEQPAQDLVPYQVWSRADRDDIFKASTSPYREKAKGKTKELLTISKDFNSKADAWLEREGFKNHRKSRHEDYLDKKMYGDDMDFSNDYLSVYLSDVAEREDARADTFSDYYEETP